MVLQFTSSEVCLLKVFFLNKKDLNSYMCYFIFIFARTVTAGHDSNLRKLEFFQAFFLQLPELRF